MSICLVAVSLNKFKAFDKNKDANIIGQYAIFAALLCTWLQRNPCIFKGISFPVDLWHIFGAMHMVV